MFLIHSSKFAAATRIELFNIAVRMMGSAPAKTKASSFVSASKAKKDAADASERRKNTREGMSDSRLQLIKTILFDRSSPAHVPTMAQTQAAATTLTPDPPVHVGADPVKTKLDAIERAWCIYKMDEADGIRDALLRKHRAMRRAMEELEKADRRLFEAALSQDARMNAESDADTRLFPRRLRIPTETPPTNGWDYGDRTSA